MALRLKSLELHGYKTFAAKINFEFAEGITAIVGPNGSGKSNIADALRWVLGEQTYSLLRAKKTEDMIFAGSEQRSRSGMASATITFDNSDGWLPTDFSEVALSRRAYRDGRNEYLLNRQHVRLRDINELLAKSGLSERTYTILGQGLVDASLALKADERRRLFEEAAGIGLYRSRREEALRRIETTKRNLDRAMDILAELEPRLRSLERQATRAQEYNQLQSDLRLLLLEWYGYHWHRAQKELSNVAEAVRIQESQLTKEQEIYQNTRKEFASYRDNLNSLRSKLNSWHRQSAQLHAERESSSSETAKLDERQRFLLDDRQAILSELSRLEEEERTSIVRLNETSKELVKLENETNDANIQMTTFQARLQTTQTSIAQIEHELEELRKRMGSLRTQQAVLEARLTELTERSGIQMEKSVTANQSILQAESETNKADEDHKKALTALLNSEKELDKLNIERDEAKSKVLALEDLLRQKQNTLASVLADAASMQAKLDVLDQADLSLAGYAEGAKFLLDAARRKEIQGTKGALADSIEVGADLEPAIAAALGEFTDAILLQQGNDLEQAILLLEGKEFNRAALLPLEWLQTSEVLPIEPTDEVLGVASRLVKTKAEFRPVIDLLLGQVLIVKDRKTARAVLAKYPNLARAVTLKGEVFHAGGPVLAGVPTKTAALGRPRHRGELRNQITRIEKKAAELENEKGAINRELSSEQEALHALERQVTEATNLYNTCLKIKQETAGAIGAVQQQREYQNTLKTSLEKEIVFITREKETNRSTLREISAELSGIEIQEKELTDKLAGLSVGELQAQVTHWTTQVAVAERTLANARDQQKERTETASRLQEQKTNLDARLKETEENLRNLDSDRADLREKTKKINKQLEDLRILIEPAEKELGTIELLESDLQKRETEGQAALARVERNTNQLQLDFTRKQEAIETLRNKIEDDFGLVMFEYTAEVSGPIPLPLDGLVEQLPVVTTPGPDLEESMTNLRAQLRRMGAINPEAKEEYKAVRERRDFLTTQIEDLKKAESDLHKVILELDEVTRIAFQKTFESVADQFRTIFHRLFGGGAAKLVLTDPENINDTGIDIEARLPGRREQGLSLLSGGERSLTAIALIFALLKVSPTPVCVLDEVDAMLDEANVGRFRDLLAELSDDTQFIIITHNRNTVQAADVIYGVTMSRDSTSQVISLKLDEISEEYYR